jgi:hypothetical protein
MGTSQDKDLGRAQGRVAALIAGRTGVRGAVQALAREALGSPPITPSRMLAVARSIRSGIAAGSGIGDEASRAAAEEALGGLRDALNERYAELSDPAGEEERRSARELRREFGVTGAAGS